MSRQQGFARGDFDTSFPLDDKFVELRGSVDPKDYYAAVGVYFTILAAAWRDAERKPGLRTTPDAPDQLADLVRVHLLDSENRVKARSFTQWIGKALASRKSDTDRKARNRAGMSGVTPPDIGGTPTESDRSPRLARGRVGQGKDGSLSVVEGGPGGTLTHTTGAIESAWCDATGLTLLASGEFASGIVDDSARRHPETEVVAAIREVRQGFVHVPSTQVLASALRARLDPFQPTTRKPTPGGHTRSVADVEGAFRG